MIIDERDIMGSDATMVLEEGLTGPRVTVNIDDMPVASRVCATRKEAATAYFHPCLFPELAEAVIGISGWDGQKVQEEAA